MVNEPCDEKREILPNQLHQECILVISTYSASPVPASIVRSVNVYVVPLYLHRGPRFTLSEDDQSFLSDNSEASGFSSFSKLSLQSNRLRQRQRLNTSKMGPAGRHVSPRISRSRPDCRSPSQNLLAEAGEEEEEAEAEVEGEGEMVDEPPNEDERRRGTKKRDEDRPADDQPKSSSTEERSASSSTAAATVAVSSGTSGAPSLVTTASAGEASKSAASASSVAAPAARKRRSSIGHRFSNVLGISKKNTVASGTGLFGYLIVYYDVKQFVGSTGCWSPYGINIWPH